MNLTPEQYEAKLIALGSLLYKRDCEIDTLKANQQVLVDALEYFMEWEGEIRQMLPRKVDACLNQAREALARVKEATDE